MIVRAEINMHAVTAADLSYFHANVRQRSTSNMFFFPTGAIVTVAMAGGWRKKICYLHLIEWTQICDRLILCVCVCLQIQLRLL